MYWKSIIIKAKCNKRTWIIWLPCFSALLFLFIGLGIYCSAWINPPLLDTRYAKEILFANGKTMHVFLSEDQKWRLSNQNQSIPRELREWIVWKEDRFFFYHPGCNPVSILRSIWQWMVTGKIQSGASTITMQIVRLQRHLPRNFQSKWTELWEALRLEARYNKEELLAYYLDHLPFGGNVEGFRAAALIYFGKEPMLLSQGQLAALVVVPNHPNRFHPLRKTEAWQCKRNVFIEKLIQSGRISAEVGKSAQMEPLFPRWHPLPQRLPHLSRFLRQRPEHVIQTSIDEFLQTRLEALLLRLTGRLKTIGIPNAAVLVTHYHTGKIEAWIGNTDFNDSENSGQVDGVSAIRSPGSTLKPFIYALALQKGMITPATILYDIPQDFGGGYSPENYDRQFRGAVSASQALIQSLNIPAISLLQELKTDTFIHFAHQLGLQALSQKTKNPGLSVAVGGCSATLFELVQAYATLGNRGIMHPLVPIQSEHPAPVITPLSPAVAEMVRAMLSVRQRSELMFPFLQNRKGYERFAWKTGTSFGRRDAWCIGFGNKRVLGLWMGDFKGIGNIALSGVDMASPIFQQLMLETEGPDAMQSLDPQLAMLGWKKRQVCVETGKKPGPDCHQTREDWFLPLISPQSDCQHVKRVDVSENEQYSFCKACIPLQGTHTILADNRQPEFVSFLRMKGLEIRTAPAHNPACVNARQNAPLRILHPADGKVFYLEGRPVLSLAVQFIVLDENVPVSLFLDGKKVAVSKKGEAITLSLGMGEYQLSIKDNSGKWDRVRFTISDFF